MSDQTTMLLLWGAGFVFFVLAIPFLPRRDTATPAQAVGLALSLALMWPALLIVLLIRYAPLWYWIKWTDYREFLTRAEAETLAAKFNRVWQPSDRAAHSDFYERSKAMHISTLSRLQAKADQLQSRRLMLEEKLRS